MDGKGQLLSLPKQGHGHIAALLAPRQIPHLVHGHFPNILIRHGDQDITRQNSCLLAGAVRVDPHHQKAFLCLLDGDAHAHKGVLHLLHMRLIATGGNVVAPPVAGSLNHGIGGGILQLSQIRLTHKAFPNQRFQVIQLGAFLPLGKSHRSQGHCNGQRRH